MYIFVTKTESGGLFWRILFNRVLFATLLSNIVVALVVKANGFSWIMLAVMGGLPVLLLAFKIYCTKTFDNQMQYYVCGELKDPETSVESDKQSRHSDKVGVRFGHPALYKPLSVPMVHAKAQHLLSEIYHGRLDDGSDARSVAEFSDTYSLYKMSKSKTGKKAKGSGPFEFVNDSEMDFENYKQRPDFRAEHGGEGELYGKPEDLIRPGTGRTYTSRTTSESPDRSRSFSPFGRHPRSSSKDSERTLGEGGSEGTTYPAGYHHTPVLNDYNPDARQGSTDNILVSAAPMGVVTPGSEGSVTPGVGRKPVGGNTYDYFRGGQ
jgi:calcium permeable stress-gated cation channel